MGCLREDLWSVWFLCTRRCWTKESLKNDDVAQKGRLWQKFYNTAIWYWTELSSNRLQTYSYEPLRSTSFVYILFTQLLLFLRVKIYRVCYVLSSLCTWKQWRLGVFCVQWQTLQVVFGSPCIDGTDQIGQRPEEFKVSGNGKRCWKTLLMACLNIFMHSMDWPPPPMI